MNRTSLGGFKSLPNHRPFSYAGLGADFPFPKGFFAVVVLRFPPATSEAVLRTVITECKRVLRPGGYVEISAIDLDLSNMGSATRKALRSLKMKMQSSDPNASLMPVSDALQTQLGRRGFENLNRCIVGVPAAGAVAGSRESSQDGEHSQADDLNFSELESDQSKEGDEHITKLVAQVGRWWYSHCYEAPLLSDAEEDEGKSDGDLFSRSMWTDRRLLRECEEYGTTFKLLIAYAQKPTLSKRRTVSL